MKNGRFIVRWLARIRDSRLLWEIMGGIYNQRIYTAISILYERAAGEISLPSGARLLDAGCGRGYAAIQLAAKYPDAQMTGIDYSIMQIGAARKFQREKRIANCAFERGDVMKIRFAGDTFDAAVSIGSIKHWPDAVRGLGEIRRVLKPGGVLLIAETDQDASDHDIRRFMERFKVWFVPAALLFWGLRNVIFGQSVTQASLKRSLIAAGFRGIECLRVPAVPYVVLKAIR